MKHETAPSPAIIAKLTNEQLLKAWETTEFLSTSPETAITRGECWTWYTDAGDYRSGERVQLTFDGPAVIDATPAG